MARLSPSICELLKLSMTHVDLSDQQIVAVDRLVAQLLGKHEQAVKRVAEIPGFGVDSAQQAIAEIGIDAADFPSAPSSALGLDSVPAQTKPPSKTRVRDLPEATGSPAVS